MHIMKPWAKPFPQTRWPVMQPFFRWQSLSRADSRRELPTQAIQLTQQEERETGDLGTQIYRAYVQTSKEWWMFAGMIVAEFIPIILQVATTDVKRGTKLKIGLISLL